MNYFDSVPKGFFVNSCSVIQLYYDDFLSFVRTNNINDIFRVGGKNQYFVEKDIRLDSKSGYFFCVMHNNSVFVTDSLGFSDLETLEESIKNGSLGVIFKLKRNSKEEIFSEDPGLIYDWMTGKGYRTGVSIEGAYRFFEGDISLDYEYFVRCKEEATRAGFNTYKEICIAKEGGFIDADDLEDAERYRAPNKQALDAVRVLIEIKGKFKFKDLSESLIAGVIASLALEKNELNAGSAFVEMNDIFSRQRYWSPEVQNENFGGIRTMEGLIDFLEGPKGRMIGHYDSSNRQFQFSYSRIYIDGANIAYKGLYKGERREQLSVPDMQVLKECYQRLLNENIGNVRIYMDGLVVKHIRKHGPQANLKILDEFQASGVLEASYKGERADEPLLQKLRDDPFAYVVANDSYAKDYHLTKRDEEHLIQVAFHDSEMVFHGKGYDSLQAWVATFLDWGSKLHLLLHTRELGTWPYSGDWFEFHIGSRTCC